jgi:hypothetical protein
MNGGDGMNGSNGSGSGNGSANGRGKTLLPEFLPAPRSRETQSPPDRVAERARLLLQRFRGIGTAASAALFSLNCNNGYMVVDPLPPPPQSCTSSPDPFATIYATGMWGSATPGSATPPPAIIVLQTPFYPPGNLVGFSIAAVRVTGGTLVSTQDMSSVTRGGGTRFHITVAPASAAANIAVEVDFTCSTAATTKHYMIAYFVPADPSQTLIVTEQSPPADAGTD